MIRARATTVYMQSMRIIPVAGLRIALLACSPAISRWMMGDITCSSILACLVPWIWDSTDSARRTFPEIGGQVIPLAWFGTYHSVFLLWIGRFWLTSSGGWFRILVSSVLVWDGV
ncbi:hypothetical protein BDV28DRAFT_139127 [Aspergillus coremiiformis]|uniref:Uncharacterized protein n=1 Tax=Aspergillus coremiiformis TaxID=138285 RepID=A0A5N6YYA9_9EURO|nr:hypothetical protein BDV28DRAFT_139127 [Aspergillus coremiiformis]